MHQATQKDQCLCLLCFEPIEQGMFFMSFIFGGDVICGLCRYTLRNKYKVVNILNMKVMTFYEYEGYGREVILRYKDGLDKWLAPLFLYPYKYALRIAFKSYTVVYVPSSKQRIESRGFDHNNRLVASVFKDRVVDCFDKVEAFKQSERSLHERERIHEVIRFRDEVKIEATKILLFDDIMTTGNSLKACYDILVKKGYNVKVMALYAPRSGTDGRNHKSI